MYIYIYAHQSHQIQHQGVNVLWMAVELQFSGSL